MSNFLLETCPTAPTLAPSAPPPNALPIPATPARLDRRRPGRIENASPELIALMRKPSHAARVRVALYDAPGFLLQSQPRRPRTDRRSVAHMAIAMTACSVLSAVAFRGMIALWG